MIVHTIKRIGSFCYQKQKTLLTGIQPTGDLHIGNYLGSIQNMLKLQQDHQYTQKYLMIADYHSLTTAFTHQHSTVKYNNRIGHDTFLMAKLLLASGIDPNQMCLFVQSQNPAHCELTWILSCLGPQFWLNTMIQYKQKSHKNSSVGLYTYPILMAVDILLYQATHVPVGIDQKQHIELANNYVERFNKLFKTNFFPKVNYFESQVPKVMSLVDPISKMSKSDTNTRSRINLSDSREVVNEKIRRAVTDSNGNFLSFDPITRPGLSNLLQIFSAFSSKSIDDIVEECQKDRIKISEFKEKLSQLITSKLQSIQNGLAQRSDDQVRNILSEGAIKARQKGEANLLRVKQLLDIYI